jgi:hypothetical protein
MRDRVRCAVESDRHRIVRQFEKHHGYPPDLEDPKTWNEKIQCMKLYDHNPLFTRCADKYRMREVVEEAVGSQYLVPLLGVYDDARTIDFRELPDAFVIKANHGSGWNLIIRSKSECDERAIVTRCNKWLARNYYVNHREWQYKNIRPLLVVEELLLDDEGRIPADFKVQCFDHGRGEPVIVVDKGRFTRHTRDHYDAQWNRLDLTYDFPQSKEGVDRPRVLEKMLSLARRLAEPFAYVRVDLYVVHGKIYVGELTFSPMAGYCGFDPEETDLEWGARFTVPTRDS